jgi:hypothetical protein
MTHRLHEPVVPGQYDTAVLQTRTTEVLEAARHFAAWLAGYEAWVLRQMGPDYRNGCRHMLDSLPKGRVWLPAAQAMSWLNLLVTQGAAAPRASTLRAGRRNRVPETHLKLP